jgi:hypothetical protein
MRTRTRTRMVPCTSTYVESGESLAKQARHTCAAPRAQLQPSLRFTEACVNPGTTASAGYEVATLSESRERPTALHSLLAEASERNVAPAADRVKRNVMNNDYVSLDSEYSSVPTAGVGGLGPGADRFI